MENQHKFSNQNYKEPQALIKNECTKKEKRNITLPYPTLRKS